MTRSSLVGPLVGIAFIVSSAAPPQLWAQTGETKTQSRPSSRYSTLGNVKAPAAGSKTQPSSGTASGSPGATYGPAAPASGQSRGGQAGGPVRRAGAEEPVREPMAGEIPGNGKSPSGGIPRTGPDGINNPIPVIAQNTPRQPKWYPLTPERQKWTDEILRYWEATSEQIVTFNCTFQRWEHVEAFRPPDPMLPYTYGEGIIKYAKPDKGLFKIESLRKYVGVKKEGDDPWVDEIGEHWVSDGRSIFEYDIRRKKLIQRILPKEMQGKAIADGPLPFLFGAKSAEIKARYWIQVLDPPPGSKGEYWLEAVPRFAQDAANFQMVSIILDEKDFLPKALDVYAPNYDSRTNRSHTEYSFIKRETTLKSNNQTVESVNEFLKKFKTQFYEPKVPFGWKKEIEDMNAMPQGPAPAQGPAPGTAKRPGTTKTKTK